MKKLTYIQGAFILTLTNMVTGTLAFVYRIFLSRSIGAEGIGIYQLVLPLYNLFITLVSGGITTAVSKLTAEQGSKNNYRNIYKIIKICCLLVGIWSLIMCVGIIFGSNYIAVNVLKDARTLYSIMIFVPAILFIAIAAILKGYFFGLQDVNPPALIDVVEKIIRLGVLLVTTSLMIPYGIEYVCAGAMAAMTAGEFISLLLLIYFYKKRKVPAQKNSHTDSTLHIIRTVLMIAIPLSISGALNTIMDMINAILVPMQLRSAGFSSTAALSLYGELTGMVMPLMFYPFIIVVSLGITLVPAITYSYQSRNWIALNKKCNDSMKITSVIALTATTLFLIFPKELCNTFFRCPEAGSLLFWSAIMCLFIYWQFTLFAILNGVGMQFKVLENCILNIVVTMLCAFFLIPIPSIGIYGFIIGFNISAVLVVARNLQVLRKIPDIKFQYGQILMKPLFCFVGMFATTKLFSLSLSGLKYCVLVSSLSGLLVFFILLFITGTFTHKQIKSTIVIK